LGFSLVLNCWDWHSISCSAEWRYESALLAREANVTLVLGIAATQRLVVVEQSRC